MRLFPVLCAALLAGCSSAPKPAPAPIDPTTEAWYPKTAQDLAAKGREAEALFQKGEFEKAAAIVTEGQPLLNRLLSAPQPTLAALEAVSDMDDLYARMLLRNRHYGWARTLFQKNVYRWKNRKPETTNSVRRLLQARTGLAACDRHIGE